MAIWKISHGTVEPRFTAEELSRLRDQKVVVMDQTTRAGQGQNFISAAQVGDLFYLCYRNKIQLLGRFLSNAEPYDIPQRPNWLQRRYETLHESRDTNPFRTPERRKWSPSGNSTFFRVPPSQLGDFESTILLPYFGVDLVALGMDTQNGIDTIVDDASEDSLNTIFYGAPGTGKTFIAPRRAVELCGYDYSAEKFRELVEQQQIVFVTFHQSYSYEDFVEGFRPAESANESVVYSVQSGIFKKIANRASENWKLANGIGQSTLISGDDFDARYQSLCEQIEQPGRVAVDTSTGIRYPVRLGSSDSHLRLQRGEHPDIEDFYVKRKWLKKLWAHRDTIKQVSDITRLEPNCPARSYHFAVLNKLKSIEVNSSADTQSAESEAIGEKNFVIIIDEINRANISKVFGELITLIEKDKRLGADNELTVTLPYSGDSFGIPPNLYIIGTMNTADRSIALLDIALRRRFEFEEIAPDVERLPEVPVEGIDLRQLLAAINQRIEFLVDRDHRIGHAYLMHVKSLAELKRAFSHKIIPLLQEYCYDDWGKIVKILATTSRNNEPYSEFVERIAAPDIPGMGIDEGDVCYRVTPSNNWLATAFTAIYQPAE